MYMRKVFGGRLNRSRDLYVYEDEFCDIIVEKINEVYVCKTRNYEFGFKFNKYEIIQDIDEVVELVDNWIVDYCASARGIFFK